jgi:hypothetical protein
MNIDRSRFLLLAAALSANACTIIDNRGKTDAAPAADDTGSAGDTSVEDTGTVDSAAADVSDARDASDAPMCTDEGITVPACSGTTPGGCVLDTAAVCTQFPTYFTPRAAKLAIDCALMSPACEGVVPDPLWQCGLNALKGACPDATVDGYCTTLASTCAAADGGADAGFDLRADCKTYAAGLNAAGRTRLQELVTAEGGCSTPLSDLLTGL